MRLYTRLKTLVSLAFSMAPKPPSPLEDRSSPSSSEEEEEEEESEEINDREDQEQEQEQNKLNEEYKEEEEEEYEDEEEEQRGSKKHSVQRPTISVSPQKPRLLDDEGSASETQSNEIRASPTASDFTIRPNSKPDPTNTKETSSKAAAPTSKKRPAESEQMGKETQKKNKVSNGDEEEGAVENKKSAINRLWSEDDEIAILKGLIEYQSKKGADPHADMGAFDGFIKKSLHVDVSKAQLVDKVRRLKKKYQNNAEKGEKGKDPVFSKPHDHMSFKLSKKIWGRGAGNGNSGAKKSVEANDSTPLPKEDRPELSLGEGLKAKGKELKVDQEDFWSVHPLLLESLELEKSPYLSMPEFGKNFIKESMILIGSRKAKELEEKWKNLCMDEIALNLHRVELIQEQTKLVLDAIKASKS